MEDCFTYKQQFNAVFEELRLRYVAENRKKIDAVIQYQNRMNDGKKNKENFIKEVSLMLTTGELSYEEFMSIMTVVLTRSVESFTGDEWKQKFMKLKDRYYSEEDM
jgi:hypothetical protein